MAARWRWAARAPRRRRWAGVAGGRGGTGGRGAQHQLIKVLQAAAGYAGLARFFWLPACAHRVIGCRRGDCAPRARKSGGVFNTDVDKAVEIADITRASARMARLR